MSRDEIFKTGLRVAIILLILIASVVNVTFSFAQEVQYKKNAVYVTVPSSAEQFKKLTTEVVGDSRTISLVDSVKFTGDSYYDFVTGPNIPLGVIFVKDPPGIGDVGIPLQAPRGTISGWDLDAIYFYYNHAKDRMYVGFDFGGVSYPNSICGDADGNGDPDSTPEWLRTLGGSDTLNLIGSESVVLLLDTNDDDSAEVAIGVNDTSNISHFGAYYRKGFDFILPYFHKLWKDLLPNRVKYHNAPNYPIKDLEFTIDQFSTLPNFNFTPGQSFKFGLLAFAGSFMDDGIGEEFVPDKIMISYDFGDAPSPYSTLLDTTLLDSSGAFHFIISNLFMNQAADGDPDGQPDPEALGDDNDGNDDENIAIPDSLSEGSNPNIIINVHNKTDDPAYVIGWIDYDGDGHWEMKERSKFTIFRQGDITDTLNFPQVPFDSFEKTNGTTFARFRISTDSSSISTSYGAAPDGEVEDYKVKIVPGYDFGDAPDDPQNLNDYPTLLVSNGARHQIRPGFYLGNSVDIEDNGQPDATATGDDNIGIPDDEDGVVFTSPLVQYRSATITVTASDSGMLDAWVDFNDDGDWTDPGEQIFTARPLAPGANNLTFSVPGTATPTPQTFARFRFSSQGDLPFNGLANDGEVEDYEVEIEGIDFGDAPDDPEILDDYPTLLVSNGARHQIRPGFYLGNGVDGEPDGQPDPGALGDDNDILYPPVNDDEDGVVFTSPLVQYRLAKITVTASQAGMLEAWIDFNDNNDWADPGEQIFTVQPLVAGPNNLSFPVPGGATPTPQTFARFRLSSQGGLTFEGYADDGEVEDYKVEIIAFDFSDAPDDPQNPNDYPTLLVSNGARHQIRPGFYLGSSIDAEGDGQPNVDATGDDRDIFYPPVNDDEDGVVFTSPLVQYRSATITVTASDFGMLDAWIDFNDDGDWADPGEQIFTARPLATGANNLTFSVPGIATPTPQTFARFRFSSQGDLPFNGPANDGEVEDYEVEIEGIDFGDAPDDPEIPDDYPTLLASNGAHHQIRPGFYLGNGVDGEPDGQPDPNALGDDNDILYPPVNDDEDGVIFSTMPLIACQKAKITVTASDSGMLDAWIDFNDYGDWNDPDEQIFAAQHLMPGANTLTFTVPCDATPTPQTFARFRFSSMGGLPFDGPADDGEVEDYEVEIVALDFGDAPDDPQNPDDYPTLLVSDGARHKIRPGFYLGNTVDFEGDGQPSTDANGDDINGVPDDEDGVVFNTMPLIVCQQAQVTVTASDSGILGAWIDFNDDNDWADPGEQIFTGQFLMPGPNTLTFNVPCNATPDSQTYARFRFSSKGRLSYKGLAEDGEVEDYEVQVDGFDFGDAPDDSTNPGDYPTLLLSNGAYHKIKNGFHLGKYIDPEFNGQPNADATGDDINGVPDDEDGVVFNTKPLTACREAQITVTASDSGKLDAWIDFKDDGDWADPGEKIFTDQPLVPGTNILTFTVPCDATPTPQTFARFRFSSMGGLPFDGLANDGEVEDYEVEIVALDFGDTPDDPQNPDDYPTLLVTDGARHKIKPGFFLGNTVDNEGDGHPNANATGDDIDGVPDDEDGVVFNTMPLIVCQQAQVTITASDSGILDAWVNFNDDNDWADPGEQIFTGQFLMPGPNPLTFTVPYDATPDSQTFARFRFSSTGGLSFKGLAEDGEVEDYKVKIVGFDFGDAPDDTTNPGDYPTYLISNGAYHIIKPGFCLGDSIDAEVDGQPNSTATGDDVSRVDDEDGVVFQTMPLIVCGKAEITVTASDSGMLDAWIDFENDNDWNGANEQIFTSKPLMPGPNTLIFTVPCDAETTSQTFARFRFSSKGGLSFDGPAEDGEIEDYAVEIIAADFGDAPDDSICCYSTLLIHNCAHHKIKPGFYLGESVDCEGDGQPHPDALGDGADEDGVVFNTYPLILCCEAQVTVIVSDSGKLDAWIDSNCNGKWDGKSEQIFFAQPLKKGSNKLSFIVPGGTNPSCNTFVRFRFSSAGGLSFNGFAKDGEVEDYKVEIVSYDFGDAPGNYTPPGKYQTLLVDDGARHQIDTRLYLGKKIDADADGQPSKADGDDKDIEGDDEDGLAQDTLRLEICTKPAIPVKVHNSTGKKAILIGWIDFDGQVGWTEHEKIFTMVNHGDTIAYLQLPKIPSYSKDTTYARLRISTKLDSVDRPWGFAPDGEVEDYLVIITKPIDPANLTSFEAIAENGQVSINWVTENEPFNEQFIIYRSQNDSTEFININHEMIPSQGDSITGACYQFVDQPEEIGTYYYKLECVSPDSYSTFHGPIVVKLMTTVEKESLIPKEYGLSQNYPNPFNPETHIKYAIPRDGEVTIVIYDLLGRLVRRLVDEHKSAGYYQAIWDARNDDGNVVSNGIYLLQMKSGSFMKTMKMTLIK